MGFFTPDPEPSNSTFGSIDPSLFTAPTDWNTLPFGLAPPLLQQSVPAQGIAASYFAPLGTQVSSGSASTVFPIGNFGSGPFGLPVSGLFSSLPSLSSFGQSSSALDNAVAGSDPVADTRSAQFAYATPDGADHADTPAPAEPDEVEIAADYDGNDLNYLAKRLGLDRYALGEAIHRIKDNAALRGADKIKINIPTGVVTFGGEVIGNIFDP